MKKRFLRISFLIIMLTSAMIFMCVNASAVTTGTSGDNLTWVLEDDGTLTISGTGAMTDYTSSSKAPWYSRTKVNRVIIDEGITSIGDYAFYECRAMSDITIPDSITYIGKYAFYDCDGLTEFTVSDNVTYVGAYAFNDCDNLKSTIIGDRVEGIGERTFYGCTNLTEIIFGSSVRVIGKRAFDNCEKLLEINIPDSVVTIEQEAFNRCTSLTNITLGKGVEVIGENAFSTCIGLQGITVSEDNENYSSDTFGVLFNKDKTKLIQYPCGNERTSYTVPDSVISIGNDALFSLYLTDITIGKNVKNIDNYAFSAQKLTTVYYNGTEREWEEINIDYGNDSLSDVMMHFNCSSTKTAISSDKNNFTVTVISPNIKSGDKIILALYKGSQLTEAKSGVYKMENIEFTTDKEYDLLKIFVWDSVGGMIPIVKNEIIK